MVQTVPHRLFLKVHHGFTIVKFEGNFITLKPGID